MIKISMFSIEIFYFRQNAKCIMKKILLSLLFVILCNVAYSQIIIGILFGDKLNQGPIEFGLNLNSNISMISNIENGTRSTRVGFGLYFDYNMSEKWVGSASFFFSHPAGAKNLSPDDLFYDLGEISDEGEIERQLNYIGMPLQIFYKINDRLAIGPGVYLAYLHGTNDIVTDYVDNGELTYTTHFTQYMNRFDMGWSIHLRYHFKGEPGSQMRIGYTRGFIDIYKSDELEGYNDAIQLSLLVPIKLGL